MNRARIAITGVGLVTPLASQREASWQQLLAGKATGRYLAESEIGAKGWYGAPAEIDSAHSNQSRTTLFALSATKEAIQQASLSEFALSQAACVIGTSKTDLRRVDQLFHAIVQKKSTNSEFASLFPSEPVYEVAKSISTSGPALAPVAACATGLVSLIRAAELLRQTEMKCTIAGSTDSSLHIGLLSSYRRLGVLAKAGDDPASACRPFERQRMGFIVGEGASSIVLEEWDHAISRGAIPLAEWIDGMIASDPSGLTSVDSSGETLSEVIRRLLARNKIRPDQISAISYHGTATELNDLTEARAIAKFFPNRPIGFGVKGSIGHLMGAAGSVETAFSVLALRDQVIPPTVNHVNHDEMCPNYVTGKTQVRQPVDYLIKTSLGFGGHIAVGLLKRATS